MRYFVTGATGFIGGELARQLVDAGHQVVALVRDPAGASGLAKRGVELARGDVADRESMREPMRGADGVFHVAGWYRIGARDKRPGKLVNVLGTRNVLELMKELAIPKGVYTSSLAVFSDTRGRVVDESYYHPGPWINEYDRTKWAAHYQVAHPMMKEGLPLVVVQPGAVYGPGDRGPTGTVLIEYLRRRLPVVPARPAYCWGHVEDTAQGHILAMEKGRTGEDYIIAGPVFRLADVLDLAEGITGIPAPRLRPGPGVMRLGAALIAPFERLLPLSESFSAEAMHTSAEATYLGSSAKAQSELGFSVRPLEEGLRETLLLEMETLGLFKQGVRA